MRRFKIYDLRQLAVARSCELVSKFLGFKIFLITLLLFINHKSLFINPAFAADSTPSAEARTKLQALQVEIASKAAKIKQEIGRKLQNKVYTGFIKSKSANSLTLATSQGSKIINLNEYTVYQTQNPSTGKVSKQSIKDLTTDDYILALGDIDDTAVLTAKKVIKTASPSALKQVIYGTVTSVDDSTIVIQNNEGQNISLLINKETLYKMGKSESGLDDIRLNKPVIAVGESSPTKTLKTRFVYILPYSASPRPVKSATSSGLKK